MSLFIMNRDARFQLDVHENKDVLFPIHESIDP